MNYISLSSIKNVVIILLLIVLNVQCESHYDYSDVINVQGTWSKKDTLNFNFEIKDPEKKKNINIIVRNSNDYLFSNIYLFIKLQQGKKILSLDTLNYRLADNTGQWLGSGIGSVKEIYLQYKKDFKFPEKGSYKISVVQGMRKDTLKGIEDFGITIE